MFPRLREDIANIKERDPAARSGWEVLTCYPGLQAIAIHRMAHWSWNAGMKWLGRFISHIGRFLTGIEIHPGAQIGRRVFIDHGFGVVIGETAIVGDDCTIYQGVTLGGTSLTKGTKRHPTLEKGVIVGAGAQVLGNVTVGDGAKVGSNAVVVKEVPPSATAVGNPARIIIADKKRAEDAASRVFSSYGITSEGDDPLIKALQGLINHAAAQEKQISQLTKALDESGIVHDVKTDSERFDLEKFNDLVD